MKDGEILNNQKLYFLTDTANADSLDFIKLNSFHWENDPPYRPETFFKVFVQNGMLNVIFKCYEENPRAVYTQTDETVFKDSCVEFFFSPVDGRSEYINLEMNSKGVYLCEFGNMKPDRCFIKELTAICPEVTPCNGKDDQGAFWGVKAKISKELIAELYKIKPEKITFDSIRANFYKCGDSCEIKHYESFLPVSTLPPGFHNPACFAVFYKETIN